MGAISPGSLAIALPLSSARAQCEPATHEPTQDTATDADYCREEPVKPTHSGLRAVYDRRQRASA